MTTRCPAPRGAGAPPRPPLPSGAPEPLLVERRVITGEDVDADRITSDGRVWSYSTVDARLDEAGGWAFGRVSEPEWREEGHLDPDALAVLREALAGFLDVPGEFRPDVAVIHASSEEWTADVDGRRHTSTLYARGVTRAPVLEGLAAALEAALASIDTG